MSTKEILIAAKAKIADPKHWTQGACARDSQGHRTDSDSPCAVKWCAYGALGGDDPFNLGKLPLQRASSLLFNENPSIVNDALGHPAVMQMYDKAIELAEAQ